jgi:hypothetical protein
MSDITARAMLVSLRISSWSAKKYDKRVSADVAHREGVASDVGRYTKALLPAEADTYKALQTAISDARTTYYAQTLAWNDEGWRLLPTANYMEFTDKVRAQKLVFERALDAFLNDYPSLQQSARARLNGLYDDADYPSTDDLRLRYSYTLEYSPLPSGNDFRLTLAADEIAAIAANTETRVKSAIDAAQRDAVERLFDAVSHIQERLADPKAIFRDSLIQNARELCDVLTRLNITDDARLDAIRADVARLATEEPSELRERPIVRQAAAAEAARILEQMKSTFGGFNAR